MIAIKARKIRLHKNPRRRRTIKRTLVSFSLLAVVGLSAFAFSWMPAHASLADSLVGHWKFDEGTGTAAADSSSAGNNGTIIQNGASPAWVSPGQNGSGSSLQFNGAGAVAAAGNTVNVGNGASLNGLSKYILSAWVKFEPGYVGNGGTWANIIGRTQGANFSYMLYINANGRLRAHHVQSNGGVILYDSINVIPTGEWVHIAQIADGSRIRLVINGVEDPTSSPYNGTSNSLPAANTYIGQDTREFTLLGSIDDVRIYDNFEAPGGIAGGLTAWQKADDGTATGALWTDSSGNNNDGVQGSTGARPTFTSNAINFNPAFSFDGGNDSFVYAGNMGISGANNFSSLAAFRANGAGSYVLFGNNGGIGNNFLFSLNSSGAVTVGRGGNSSGPSCGAITSTTLPMGIPGIGSYTRVNGTDAKVQLNGGGEVSGACATNFSASTRMLGRRNQTQVSSGFFNGLMGEFIHYNRTLSDAELLRVQSYLAVKYGITLDQTSPRNYVASDGTTISWDATGNATYKHNITGIGRDDNTDLDQKQSKSVNPGALVTIGNGNTIAVDNAANATTFADDHDFLLFGDDNGVVNWTMTDAPTNRAKLDRTFKAQNTGSVGSVKVQVPRFTSTAATKLPAETFQVYLLTDADGDFSSGATETLMTLNGTNFEADTALADGTFFTFGTQIMPPTHITPATDSGASDTDGITNFTRPDFTGACAVGQTVTLSIDGIPITPTAICDGTGNYVITPDNPIAEGDHIATVAAPTSGPYNFTIDTINPAPGAPTMTTAPSDTTPEFTGSCIDGQTVTLQIDGLNVTPTAVCAGSTYTITVDNPISDGNHVITAIQGEDIAGNTSAASGVLNITIDTAVPGSPTAPSDNSLADTGMDLRVFVIVGVAAIVGAIGILAIRYNLLNSRQ